MGHLAHILGQMIFKGENPYNLSSWSEPVHFNFTGYDTSPFWDVDGKSYMVGSHAWRVRSVSRSTLCFVYCMACCLPY